MKISPPTKTEILTKAIKKAVENGFDISKFANILTQQSNASVCFEGTVHPEVIIFSHEFAKAFWGKKFDYFVKFDGQAVLHGELIWQHHLQQLALSEDRIEYIGRFL